MIDRDDMGSARTAVSRTTVLLVVLLVTLVLLLCGVGYFFVSILMPTGSQEQAPVSEGMTWIRSIYGFGPSQDEQLLGPTSVAIAPEGTIYATDPQRARVLAFDPDGMFAGLIHSGGGGSAEGQLGRPSGLACDSDGNVYISDSANGKIIVFSDDSEYLREWPVPSVTGIRVIGDTLYARSLGEVVAYALDGTEQSRFGSRGRGRGPQLEPTGGLIADAAAVYVADSLNQTVKAFTVAGEHLWSQPAAATDPEASGESTGGASGQPVDLPTDVALDADGDLYVVDAFSFQVLRLDPSSGAITGQWGSDGQQDGEFMYPSGIAYDPDRDWFVIADTANNRLQIVRIAGTGGGARQAVERTLSSPYRVCAIPLAALLAVIALLGLRRRSRRADTHGEENVSLASGLEE